MTDTEHARRIRRRIAMSVQLIWQWKADFVSQQVVELFKTIAPRLEVNPADTVLDSHWIPEVVYQVGAETYSLHSIKLMRAAGRKFEIARICLRKQVQVLPDFATVARATVAKQRQDNGQYGSGDPFFKGVPSGYAGRRKREQFAAHPLLVA